MGNGIENRAVTPPPIMADQELAGRSKLWRLVRKAGWMPMLLLLMMTWAGSVYGATISGTVTNGSAIAPARVYLEVAFQDNNNNNRSGIGVSIAGPGPFTIRGCPDNGSYRIRAFMDSKGNDGILSTAEPVGESAELMMANGTLVFGSPNITLLDQVDPVPLAVTLWDPDGVTPGNGMAFVGWDLDSARNDMGGMGADKLRLEWSTNGFATVAGTKMITSLGQEWAIVSGLTNGLTYSFRVKSIVGTKVKASDVKSALIGPPTGGHALSGTVTLDGFTPPANTPLLIAAANGDDSLVAFIRYASVTDGMGFTLNGVPDGLYTLHVVVDLNKDGYVGDNEPGTEIVGIQVNGGDVNGLAPVVQGQGEPPQGMVSTQHGFNQDSSHSYAVSVRVRSDAKRMVNAYLTGPGIQGGIDLASNWWGEVQTWVNLGNTPISVGDAYTVAVTFVDDTSANVLAAVDKLLDQPPTNVEPNGNISTTPTGISWDLPVGVDLTGWTLSVYGWFSGTEIRQENLAHDVTFIPYTGPVMQPGQGGGVSVNLCDPDWNCVWQGTSFQISPPAVKPAKLTVPASSPLSANYTLTWTASSTPWAYYEIEESKSPLFTTVLRKITTFDGNVFAFNNSLAGTYYYRIRALAQMYQPSPWTMAASGCAVPGAKTVAAPAGIVVPVGDADGAFQVSWGASATAGVTYVLEEATNPLFTLGLRTAFTGPALFKNIVGRATGKTYYYRVRAIKQGFKDSALRIGANGCAVPGTKAAVKPASILVPANAPSGSYTVGWGASATPNVTYIVEEARNSAFTLGLRTAYSGKQLAANINGRIAGKTYYYRVRAIKPGLRDSAWRIGANGCNIGAL